MSRYCFVGCEVFAFSLCFLFLAFEALFEHADLRLLRLELALAQDALLLDPRPRLLQTALQLLALFFFVGQAPFEALLALPELLLVLLPLFFLLSRLRVAQSLAALQPDVDVREDACEQPAVVEEAGLEERQ